MGSIERLIIKSLDKFPVDRRSCQLLGPTALIVQALMGILAVLSLVYKRQRETQKRPWKIWLYDVSKQIIGQLFVHGVNVLISDFGSYHSPVNACTYYFLNVVLDTTLGVGLIYVVLQGSTWLLSKKLGIKGLKTGQYGNPPSIAYWLRQTAVYVFSISTMKFLLVALYAVWPDISRIGDWLLSWTGDHKSVQVIFVMGIFPLFMNVIQFWLIDSIVKASTNSITIHSTTPRNSDAQDRQPLFGSPDDDDEIPPRDVEDGPRPSSSRTTSQGDVKTLSGEDNKTKLSSGPSSLIVLAAAPHNYPPDNVDGTPSSQGSTRPRHKYKRSTSTLLDLPIAYSVPAVNPLDATRGSPRQTLLSKSYSDEPVEGAVEFDTWEKNDRWERGGGEGRGLVGVR